MVSRVSAKPSLVLQLRCEDKRVQCWGPSATKRSREHVRHECWKVGPYLEMTV